MCGGFNKVAPNMKFPGLILGLCSVSWIGWQWWGRGGKHCNQPLLHWRKIGNHISQCSWLFRDKCACADVAGDRIGLAFWWCSVLTPTGALLASAQCLEWQIKNDDLAEEPEGDWDLWNHMCRHLWQENLRNKTFFPSQALKGEGRGEWSLCS